MLTNPSTEPRTLAAPAPLTLDAIEVKLLRLPLVRPFETSFGRIDTRLIAITRVEADGISGWGEIVAMEEPLFSYETVDTSRAVISPRKASWGCVSVPVGTNFSAAAGGPSVCGSPGSRTAA